MNDFHYSVEFELNASAVFYCKTADQRELYTAPFNNMRTKDGSDIRYIDILTIFKSIDTFEKYRNFDTFSILHT